MLVTMIRLDNFDLKNLSTIYWNMVKDSISSIYLSITESL